jgi:aminoglycoside 6'-N-acetyltransferase I
VNQYARPRLVRPAGARGRDIGRALIDAAKRWGRAEGCSELASDTQPENELVVHLAVGFDDAGLVRCFHKSL